MIIEMSILNPRRLTLVTAFFLTLGTIISFAQCKEIVADAKVVKMASDINSNKSIVVEIKGLIQIRYASAFLDRIEIIFWTLIKPNLIIWLAVNT